jgi:hypothetical protein
MSTIKYCLIFIVMYCIMSEFHPIVIKNAQDNIRITNSKLHFNDESPHKLMCWHTSKPFRCLMCCAIGSLCCWTIN